MTKDFDWTKKVRRTDPDTSRDAAKAAESLASKQHGMILRAMRIWGRPMAPEEIADCIAVEGIDKVTVGRRMNELRDAGKIHRVERVVIRSGRQSWRYWLGAFPSDPQIADTPPKDLDLFGAAEAKERGNV